MEIVKEIKDVGRETSVDLKVEKDFDRKYIAEQRGNKFNVEYEDVVKNELINIGNIFAAQLGGVPKTNFPAFNDFLDNDPYIFSKLSSFEIAKYLNGEACLHLARFGKKRSFYQIARVVSANIIGDSFLTDVVISTAKEAESFKLAKNSIDAYKCTHYWIDEVTEQVYTESELRDANDNKLPLTEADYISNNLNSKTLTNWDHIPVVIEHPLFSSIDLETLAEPQLRLIHQNYKSLIAKLVAAKHSWVINADAIMDSDKGAQRLLDKLSATDNSANAAISLKSYDGRVGDVIVPIGVPQDFTPLLDVRTKLRYELYDVLKIPDMSKQSAAKANKQDKEVVASTLNRSALLDSLKLQKERLWVERAKDWAMWSGTPAPAKITAELETITSDDIVGVNNANSSKQSQPLDGDE